MFYQNKYRVLASFFFPMPPKELKNIGSLTTSSSESGTSSHPTTEADHYRRQTRDASQHLHHIFSTTQQTPQLPNRCATHGNTVSNERKTAAA